MGGYPSGRRPIKRDYLAKLVNRLADVNVHAIALDFDLRLPDPQSFDPQIPPDYKKETDTLINSIVAAAKKGKKVILAKSIWENDKGYYLDPDIYQPYGICARVGKDGRWENIDKPGFSIGDRAKANISCGYIALPIDILIVPGRLRLSDGSYIDSFALEIARAKDAAKATRFIDHNTSERAYGSYIPDKEFNQYNSEISAHELLNPITSGLLERLDGQSVIVGAHWSTLAYGRGDPIDTHATPIGNIVGAFVHANYVEAILDSRIFTPTPNWLSIGCEWIFAIIALLIFAASTTFWVEVAAVIALSLMLIIIEWVSLHQFGLFFDAFLPILALWLHSVYDRLLTSSRGESIT